MDLPRALLIDLDDTIVDSDSSADEVWLEVCKEFTCRLGSVTVEDLHAAQQIGVHAVWIDAPGNGLPEGTSVRPDRIIRSLSELIVCDTD